MNGLTWNRSTTLQYLVFSWKNMGCWQIKQVFCVSQSSFRVLLIYSLCFLWAYMDILCFIITMKVHAQLLSSVWLFLTPCSPPSSSVREIFQGRIQEWISIPFSRASSQPYSSKNFLATKFWTSFFPFLSPSLPPFLLHFFPLCFFPSFHTPLQFFFLSSYFSKHIRSLVYKLKK